GPRRGVEVGAAEDEGAAPHLAPDGLEAVDPALPGEEGPAQQGNVPGEAAPLDAGRLAATRAAAAVPAQAMGALAPQAAPGAGRVDVNDEARQGETFQATSNRPIPHRCPGRRSAPSQRPGYRVSPSEAPDVAQGDAEARGVHAPADPAIVAVGDVLHVQDNLVA